MFYSAFLIVFYCDFISHVHISGLFTRDTLCTLWSTTAWGYLWCFVNTDSTHEVSGVPCVVEQSALVMFYEGRSAVTTVANLWDISLKTNIFSSWIDLHSQVNQCSIKSLDYLNCLMRDEQCRIIPISAKGIMWQ